MFKKRGSGILLHISSLPSDYGIGDLGPGAYKFVDFLYEAKQRFWQVLPLNPTNQAWGNSPYSSSSAFAGNILFISPSMLVEEGFLFEKDIQDKPTFSDDYCDYSKVIPYKTKLFEQAYRNFSRDKTKDFQYEEFVSLNQGWLRDFVLFEVIKRHSGGKVWSEWEKGGRYRDKKYLKDFEDKFEEELEKEKFLQYLFFKQWKSLKSYCRKKNILLIGDVPIYVSYDSADVWANTGLFKLNQEKKPAYLSGVPPDYFSSTGQLWGSPVYDWEALKKTSYDWWFKRIAHNLKFFDLIRIDHFRGLVAFWEVEAGQKTAVKGVWQKAPAEDFLKTLTRNISDLPIIAEDLGLITPDVVAIRNKFNIPGMKVLLFAFGEDNPNHPYLPYNYEKNCVVYTGTHDNNTIRGWFEKEAGLKEKRRLFRYLGRKVSRRNVHWELIRMAMGSVAQAVIFPMQDILGLGEEARMNTPSTPANNWKWRLLPTQLKTSLARQLLELTEVYGRA